MIDPGADRLFAVINPVAGRCDAATVKDILAKECDAAERVYDCYLTTGSDDVTAIVRQALDRGYRRIVVAGGDGMIAAVASALIGRSIPLALLPVGTANLLAREVGIPLELEDACQLAVNGQHLRQVDAMQVGKQLFFSRISIGVYSKITEKTSPAAKRYFRRIAYVWNALPALFKKRSWRFTLEVDGQVSHPRASSVVIANVGTVGAGDLRWGADIAPDDGYVDICIVRGRTLWDYVVLGWHVLQHRHQETPKLVYLRAKHSVRIRTRKRTRKPLPVRGDGEIVPTSLVEIGVLPQALQVVAPAESEVGSV